MGEKSKCHRSPICYNRRCDPEDILGLFRYAWVSLQAQIVNFELRILTQSRVMGHRATSKLRRRFIHDLCNGRRVWVWQPIALDWVNIRNCLPRNKKSPRWGQMCQEVWHFLELVPWKSEMELSSRSLLAHDACILIYSTPLAKSIDTKSHLLSFYPPTKWMSTDRLEITQVLPNGSGYV